MLRKATLCPGGIASTVTRRMPSTSNSVPGAMATRAIATLSVGCRWMAEFSAVGNFAISSSIISTMSSDCGQGKQHRAIQSRERKRAVAGTRLKFVRLEHRHAIAAPGRDRIPGTLHPRLYNRRNGQEDSARAVAAAAPGILPLFFRHGQSGADRARRAALCLHRAVDGSFRGLGDTPPERPAVVRKTSAALLDR